MKNISEIERWCNEYLTQKNWSITNEGVINVDGNCEVTDIDAKKLPYKFGVVKGSFYAWADPYKPSRMSLETLENCPDEVRGDFFVAGNPNLKTLEGGPKTVMGKYKCNNCAITTLDGVAEYIGEGLYAYANPLEDITALDKISLPKFVDFEFCPIKRSGKAYEKLIAECRVSNID